MGLVLQPPFSIEYVGADIEKNEKRDREKNKGSNGNQPRKCVAGRAGNLRRPPGYKNLLDRQSKLTELSSLYNIVHTVLGLHDSSFPFFLYHCYSLALCPLSSFLYLLSFRFHFPSLSPLMAILSSFCTLLLSSCLILLHTPSIHAALFGLFSSPAINQGNRFLFIMQSNIC